MNKLFLILFILLTNQLFGQLSAANYSIENISINSKYSDYGTSYFGPNRIIFASSKVDARGVKSKFKKKRNQDDVPKYDLYKGYVDHKGQINHAKRVMNQFITKYNESNVSFTPDLKYVYFTQNNIRKGKYVKNESDWVNMNIYRATMKSNGEWDNVVSLPFNNSNYSCAHPSVSEDGKMLFFASDMPGTKGQSDIYWVTILENGQYGEPQNIGSHVNSIAKENFPYVDKNILYFSSNRTGTVGGLDVFMVALDDPNATPVNLGSTINSAFDDFSFVIDRQNKKGFFSSNRPGGKGLDDIYYFTQDTEIQECKQVISGVIKDKDTNEIIPGAVVTMFSHENIRLGSYPVKEEAIFSFDLACRDNYRVAAEMPGYKATFRHIGFSENVFFQEVTLYLEKIPEPIKPKEPVVVVTLPKEEPKKPDIIVEVSESKQLVVEEKPIIVYREGKEMLDLPPIYFDLDQHYLTEEAIRILGRAILILHENPNISIEFGAHTDCRSSDSYNLHLSNLRAREVVEHMQNAGIATNRIKGRGYGESRLVNHCKDEVKCSEPEHLQNRRTEFVIIKK